MRALLFLGGEPPKLIPDLEGFQLIACTDGAFHYLTDMDFPLQRLSFVSGDFDSYQGEKDILGIEFIHTPNQDKTDFEKSLELLMNKGATQVEIYGGSGGEMDHFLGNLSVAHRYKDLLEIKFYDKYSEYFFIPKNFIIDNAKGKMISLYPFPSAEKITTKGLHWDLHNDTLLMHTKISTRNYADEDEVSISYSTGDLLVFVGKYMYGK